MFFNHHFKYLWNGGLNPDEVQPGVLRERRTVSASIFFLVPIGFIVIVANAVRDLHDDNLIIAIGLIFVSSALYVQASLNSTKFAANMTVVGFWAIIVSVMITSGMLGQTWLWLFAVPAVAALLGGLASGVCWSLISAFTIWTFTYLQINEKLNLDQQVQSFNSAYLLGLAFEGTLVLMLLCIAVLIFRHSEIAAEEKLKKTVLTLEHEVHHRAVAEEEARNSEQSKSAFLAAMSHELRTPLNGVIGALQLLHDSDKDSEKIEYATIARQSGEILLELINNIMDLSSLESGSIKLENIVIDLHTLIKNTTAPFIFQAKNKGIDFVIEIGDSTHRYITGDPTRLRQVLINLVGNSLKFTETGEVKVEVGVSTTKEKLTLVVSDTGIGIPKKAQASLFEPYVQAESSTTRKFGGSGLGLSIVQKLISAMDGSIKVDSNPNEGSKFTIKLPCTLAEAPVNLEVDEIEKEISPMNILVADDNAVNRMVLSRLLEKDEHSVVSVTNGQEAVDYLCNHDIDLVLMDIQMPELDGISATKIIRSFENEKSNTPVVAITANTSNEEVNRRELLEWTTMLRNRFTTINSNRF